MNEDRQTQTEIHKVDYCEDEIELIYFLKVIWKWKYPILAGTVGFCLTAALISLNMNKIYSIDMVLKPGILNVGEQGTKIYVDSPQNIKDLIESGKFNNDILTYLNDMKMEKIPTELNFKVIIPGGSKIVTVKYETDDIDRGVKIQTHLSKLLIKEYAELVQSLKKEYDMKSGLIESEIDHIKTEIDSYQRNMKNIEKRIGELLSEVKLIKNNTSELMAERHILLTKLPKKNNTLSTLVYLNIIQQNLNLSNNYLNEIINYKLKKENELRKIQLLYHEIEKKETEVKKLQSRRNNIQNIQVLQPAGKNLYLIKPRTTLSAFLAFFAGLFLMLILVFLIEYVYKYKNEGRPKKSR